MPDYHASTVSGSRWRRWRRIVIENPRDALPSALIAEEEVVVLSPDDVVERHTDTLSLVIDPAAVIPLRDPLTWELTGATLTMGELYAALGSVCWKAALDRDAAYSPTLL